MLPLHSRSPQPSSRYLPLTFHWIVSTACLRIIIVWQIRKHFNYICSCIKHAVFNATAMFFVCWAYVNNKFKVILSSNQTLVTYCFIHSSMAKSLSNQWTQRIKLFIWYVHTESWLGIVFDVYVLINNVRREMLSPVRRMNQYCAVLCRVAQAQSEKVRVKVDATHVTCHSPPRHVTHASIHISFTALRVCV